MQIHTEKKKKSKTCHEKTSKKKKEKKNFMGPLYGWGSTALRLEPLQGGSLLFTASFQKFLVFILSASEGWKAKSTLEPPSGFEHETPGLGIQHLDSF